jgi:hypothetical protein
VFAQAAGNLGIDAGVARVLELAGIVAFAISGGLLAVRQGSTWSVCSCCRW